MFVRSFVNVSLHAYQVCITIYIFFDFVFLFEREY
jgi:hypothetical protein